MTVYVFDAFGTLFDTTTATIDALRPACGEDAESAAALWRKKQLEYSWLRTIMNRYADFDRVTYEALEHAMAQFRHGASSDELTTIASAYERLPLFEDANALLRRLSGERLVILSNGTLHTLQAMANNTGILFDFEYLLSADAVRSYKPDSSVYNLVLDKCHVTKEEVIFITSNAWDAHGAAAFGYQTVWCNRNGDAHESLPPSTGLSRIVTSLSEL